MPLSFHLQRLGIIVDADLKIMDRWHSLRNILHKLGYSNVPHTPDPNGTIIDQIGKPRVGIWLMPNNRLPGMLEDFVRFLVPPNDQLWDLVTDTVDAIPQDKRLFLNVQKAYVHTWLAWQKNQANQWAKRLLSNFWMGKRRKHKF